MKDHFRARWVFILAVLFATFDTGAAAQSNSTLLVPAATTDRPYDYQLTAMQSSGKHAPFTKVDGNNANSSAEASAEDLPDCVIPTEAIPLVRNRVNRSPSVTIFQFARFKTERSQYEFGAFGNFNFEKNKIDWCGIPAPPQPADPQPADPQPADPQPADPQVALLVNAVNASKVILTGSIVVFNPPSPDTPAEDASARDLKCKKQDWKIVTEAVESSNILLYDSSEVSVFCHKGELIVVLPVHAIWASVYFNSADFNDPSWKPVGEVPLGHDCDTGDQVGPDPKPDDDPPPVERFYPQRRIRPCDLIVDNNVPKKERYLGFYPIAEIYNRLTQPGATQGTASIAPIDLTAKGTYDGQVYVSTRQGPGWLGFTGMFEHDMTTKDDLNSLTAALTYDWRWRDRSEPQPTQFGDSIQNSDYFLSATTAEPEPGATSATSHMPPVFGLRWPEFNIRFGPEFTPGGPEVTSYPKMPPPQAPPPEVAQRKLNLVAGATARLPFVFSFEDQPSALTVLPVIGIEEGKRYDPPEVADMAQPAHIVRLLGGIDGSVRSFWSRFHNFLGDKPITLDYSYRLRRLFSAEPSIDESRSPVSEILRAGTRAYDRVTLIVPYSAYVQLRLSWQHGSLPPEFQYVDSLITLGVTYSNPGSSEH